MQEESTRPRAMRWSILLVAMALLAALASTHRGRAATDPLAECVDYVASVKNCFGERRARSIALSAPPSDPTERAAAAKRCAEDRVRIERACR